MLLDEIASTFPALIIINFGIIARFFVLSSLGKTENLVACRGRIGAPISFCAGKKFNLSSCLAIYCCMIFKHA